MVKKKRQRSHDENSSSTDSSEGGLSKSPSSGSMCQHVKKSVDVAKLRKALKVSGGIALDCPQCLKMPPSNEASEDPLFPDMSFEYDNTLWLCLKCGSQLCGRSRNQHALQHYKTPHSDSHALTMNTRSCEIWCYECDNEVSSETRKNLLECVEVVKKYITQAESNSLENGSNTFIEEEAQLIDSKVALPLPPPPPPIPGIAKRVTDPAFTNSSSTPVTGVCGPGPRHMDILGNFGYPSPNTFFQQQQQEQEALKIMESLPRVRGLTNLGNTCFFNAVMQCLAQTPYLLEVLKESSEAGEEFILPGGTFKWKDEDEIELPMIKGKLTAWGSLTAALANTLEELQTGGGVFTPSKLFDKLCTKCPQFRGGDQHDSHELLRHLLESVRSEDLKRYQRVILQNLGYKDQDINSVSDEMRQKCKIYGNQAGDRILRPEQVFRGFLVSTLTCQDCYNTSSRHEYFLDISLPVAVEKAHPPQRRKSSPDSNGPSTSFFLNQPSTSSAGDIGTDPLSLNPVGPTKSQLKREKEKERKAKRAAKHRNNKLSQKRMLDDVVSAFGDQPEGRSDGENDDGSDVDSSESSSEQSDADVEDNLQDDNLEREGLRALIGPMPFDSNGNSEVTSPTVPEKCDDSPENMDKDSLDEDENDSGIATSPANPGSNFITSTDTNSGGGSSDVSATVNTNTSIVAVGLSEKGASIVRQLSANGEARGNGDAKATGDGISLSGKFEQLSMEDQKAARMRAKRVRTQSHSDWSTTIAPRYQCEEGECSVQSCLNSFTSAELLSGSNKVGCESCTKRINGDDPKAKSINTDATKQLLISSPPAVLILHLKRFQIGARCMFRKLTRSVTFSMILDIAPFCGSKVKNLPNIDRKQKKLLYALYGVVEHSGSMYGGHYTAFVKVRPKLESKDKRWKFIPQGSKAELDQDDEQLKKLEELLAKEKARELRLNLLKSTDDSDDLSNSNSSTSSEEPEDDKSPLDGAIGGMDEAQDVRVPPGKWYYVSDSHVMSVDEDRVLRAQAYLLFYERIY